MTSAPPTQPHAPAPPPAPPRAEAGVDLPTLIITAIASAVAAYVTSKVWAPGTLASAAFTPVLVALVKEGLRRPTQAVTTVVPPVRPRARRRAGGAGPGPGVTAEDDAIADLPQPAIVAVEPPPVTYHRTTGRRLRWRIALITGLLGFVVCAALYTVPELLTSGQGTTLFGGGGTKHVTRTISTQSTTVVKPGKTVTTTAPTTTTTPADTQSTSSTQSTPTVTTTVTTPPAATTPAPTTTSTDTAPTTPTTPDTSANPVP